MLRPFEYGGHGTLQPGSEFRVAWRDIDNETPAHTMCRFGWPSFSEP